MIRILNATAMGAVIIVYAMLIIQEHDVFCAQLQLYLGKRLDNFVAQTRLFLAQAKP